jgi:hypothetical protein
VTISNLDLIFYLHYFPGVYQKVCGLGEVRKLRDSPNRQLSSEVHTKSQQANGCGTIHNSGQASSQILQVLIVGNIARKIENIIRSLTMIFNGLFQTEEYIAIRHDLHESQGRGIEENGKKSL